MSLIGRVHRERSSRRRRSRGEDQPEGLQKHLDLASEVLLMTVLVVSPWLFGTTEPWSIRIVNVLNFVLGAILLWKVMLRRSGSKPEVGEVADLAPRPPAAWWRRVPLIGAFLALAYTALSAWNARATFIPDEQRFEYLKHIAWLPHSYDRAASWDQFLRMLAAACFFFSLTDWLGGRGRDSSPNLSARTKRLLWVLCANGALLGVEGLLQRLSKTDKLLWLVRPELTIWWTVQFGPYAYRSNAAQLFNMLWPMALGFFLAIWRELKQGFGKGPETLLVLLCAIMAVCPIMTSSRLGLAVAAVQMCACVVWVGVLNGRERWRWTAVLAAATLLVAGAGIALNWKHLSRRFDLLAQNGLGARSEIYVNSHKMADDYPVFGVGPGAFASVYQLYRETPDQFWYAAAHDDWLEARVTYGFLGMLLLMAPLGGVLIPPLRGLLVSGKGGWLGFLYISAGGLLLSACWDLPLQVYSVLLYFLTVLALVFAVTPVYSRK